MVKEVTFEQRQEGTPCIAQKNLEMPLINNRFNEATPTQSHMTYYNRSKIIMNARPRDREKMFGVRIKP